MNSIETAILTDEQIIQITELTDACRAHDHIRLTYPTDETGDGCHHFLLYQEDARLIAALSLIFLDDGLAECCAFTHPEHRRQGHFTRLLEHALDTCEECDILFPVPESCPDTMAALAALGAELESREHRMELETPPDLSGVGQRNLTLLPSEDEASCAWQLFLGDHLIGRCLTTPASGSCICLHHVEIDPDYRRQGYGAEFLTMLLSALSASGIRKVILQVPDSNEAALALYKKAGFRITETLSYYAY